MRRLITTLMLALLATPLAAQEDPEAPREEQKDKSHAPGHLYAKGLLLESGEGELAQAIGVYRQLLEQHRSSRIFSARGLYRMGVCYRRLGKRDAAAKAFARVVEQFGDQREVAWMARRALDGLRRKRDRRPVRERRAASDVEALGRRAENLERELHGLLRKLEARPGEKDELVPRIESLRAELKKIEARRKRLAAIEREFEAYARRLKEIGVNEELRGLMITVAREVGRVGQDVEKRLALLGERIEGDEKERARTLDEARSFGRKIIQTVRTRHEALVKLAKLYAAVAEVREEQDEEALAVAREELAASQSRLLERQQQLLTEQQKMRADFEAWTARLIGERRERERDRERGPHERRWREREREREGERDRERPGPDDREREWRKELDAMASKLLDEGVPEALVKARIQLEKHKFELSRLGRQLEKRLDRRPRDDAEAERLDRGRNIYRSVVSRLREGLEHAEKATEHLAELKGKEREMELTKALTQLAQLASAREKTFEQLRTLLRPEPPHRREGPRERDRERHERRDGDGERDARIRDLERRLEQATRRLRELEKERDKKDDEKEREKREY